MNREILFRGKRKDGGGWVYGALDNLIKEKEHIHCIQCGNHPFYIKPETVGQYTGFDDSKGERIFEGDRISLKFIRLGYLEHICKVIFYKGSWMVENSDSDIVNFLSEFFELPYKIVKCGDIYE